MYRNPEWSRSPDSGRSSKAKSNGSSPYSSKPSWPGESRRQKAGVVLPDIHSPVGPAGPVEGPITPDREQSSEKKAAETWFQDAEKGDADAQNSLGQCYANGHGLEQDMERAVFWWQKAASQGHADAQYNLAMFHLKDTQRRSISQDPAASVQLLQAASETDHAAALCALASLYEHGYFVEKDLTRCRDLYRRAASLGLEEAEMRALIVEDKYQRDQELSLLETKINSIRGGFIQLQLERAAHEEVTHAYKGAGFFLSNVKSDTPIRSRIEQAHRAAREIKLLREELKASGADCERLRVELEAKTQDTIVLEKQVAQLTKETQAQAKKIVLLTKLNEDYEITLNKHRNQVNDLLAENSDLRIIAEWSKNQRIETLTHSLCSIVKSTIFEQNDRERHLKSEIEQLRQKLSKKAAAVVPPDVNFEENSSKLLRKFQRDMFIQDALLKMALEGVRGEDFEDHIQLLKQVIDSAHSGEGEFAILCNSLLDHIDEGCALPEQDAIVLKESLDRIAADARIIAKGRLNEETANKNERKLLQEENEALKKSLLELHQKVAHFLSAEEKSSTRKKELDQLQQSRHEEQTYSFTIEGMETLSSTVSELHVSTNRALGEMRSTTQSLTNGALFRRYAKGNPQIVATEADHFCDTVVSADATHHVDNGDGKTVRKLSTHAEGEKHVDAVESKHGNLVSPNKGAIGQMHHNYGRRMDEEFLTMIKEMHHSLLQEIKAVIIRPTQHDIEYFSGLQLEEAGPSEAIITQELIAISEEVKAAEVKLEQVVKSAEEDGVVDDHEKILIDQAKAELFALLQRQEEHTKASMEMSARAENRANEILAEISKRMEASQANGPSDHSFKLEDIFAQGPRLLNEMAAIRGSMAALAAESEERMNSFTAERKKMQAKQEALEEELEAIKIAKAQIEEELNALKTDVELRVEEGIVAFQQELEDTKAELAAAIGDREKAIREAHEFAESSKAETENQRKMLDERFNKMLERQQEAIKAAMIAFVPQLAQELSSTSSAPGIAPKSLEQLNLTLVSIKEALNIHSEKSTNEYSQLDDIVRHQNDPSDGSLVNSEAKVLIGTGTQGSDINRRELQESMKEDVQSAVIGAVTSVLERHPGGVVLLNTPDHNSRSTSVSLLRESVQEQKLTNATLKDNLKEMVERFERIEKQISIRSDDQSLRGSADRDIVQKGGNAKLLFAVEGPAGQSRLESRFLKDLEADQLAAEVQGMKELLHSWYRSFSFVSRLQNAVTASQQ